MFFWGVSNYQSCWGLYSPSLVEVGGQVDGQQTHPPSRKSLSCERTFKAEFSAVELRNRLKELCRQVAEDTWHCVLSIPGPEPFWVSNGKPFLREF